MKNALQIGVWAAALLFVSVAGAATISPSQSIEVSFLPFGQMFPTANELRIGIADTGNPIDLLTLQLYDGNILLGEQTSGPSIGGGLLNWPGQANARTFTFISETNSYDYQHATTVDFASIQEGTIHLRLMLNATTGNFNFGTGSPFDPSGVSINQYSGGQVSRVLNSYSFSVATITEIPTTVPLPNSVLLMLSGLSVFLQAIRKQ